MLRKLRSAAASTQRRSRTFRGDPVAELDAEIAREQQSDRRMTVRDRRQALTDDEISRAVEIFAAGREA